MAQPVLPTPRSSVIPEAVLADDATAQPGASGSTDADADEVARGAAVEAAHEPGPVAPGTGVAPVVHGDWLASVCPYLASEDGTYRSAEPDEGHRCTAQDPAATLPLAFQERFCLTDQHPRCEMYKFAQEARTGGATPSAALSQAGPPTVRTRRRGGGGPPRSTLMVMVGIGGIVVLLLVLALAMSSCSGDGGATGDGEPTSQPQATQAAGSDATPTPAPQATATPEPDPDATPDESAASSGAITILYEIQPDEALLKVSETFGVSRNRLRRDNPGLEDIAPADLPGTVIEITLASDFTLEEAEALPGYQGIAP
jgi:hypothetical protein